MRNLFAGFILIIALPLLSVAEAPNQGQNPQTSPSGSKPLTTFPEKGAGSAERQSEAYAACIRATQRFDQQEKAKGNPKIDVTSLSASCKEELKPAEYWLCMEKEAAQNVDFNTAHGRCGRQLNIR